MSNVLPAYHDVSEAVESAQIHLHASQIHGLICGLLCANPKENAPWEELITGQKQKGHTHKIFKELYAVSHTQLYETLFEFELLLPSDEDALESRAEAITLWCQGFLTGLKLLDVPLVDRDEGEVTEAINDLIEIAQMNYEDVVASEEDEVAYNELIEYVRMAAILIFQELQPSLQANRIH